MSCFPLQTLTKLRLARHPLSNDEKKAFEVIFVSYLYTNEVEKFVEKEDREYSKWWDGKVIINTYMVMSCGY